MENLYEVLEVSKNASKEVIEKAYKVLAKRYHPDVAKNKDLANKMMVKINEAYSVLSDEQKRKEYDTMLKEHEIYARETQIRQEQETYIENQYAQNHRHTGVTHGIKIDNRVLVAVIAIALIFFVIACVNIFQTISNITSGNIDVDKTYINYVDDPSLSDVIYEFIVGIKTLNIDNLIPNIVNKDYFTNIDVSLIKENMDMYKKVLGDLQITVNYAKSYKDTGKVEVVIQRNNAEDIFAYYYISSNFGLSNFNKEQERKLFENIINNNSKSVKIKDTYIVQKVDERWKIELTNMNIINLLGMKLDKYEDVFRKIY